MLPPGAPKEQSRSAAERAKAQAEQAKLDAEIDKLRAEHAKLEAETRHVGRWLPWGIRTLLPTVVAAVAVAASTAWFSDSQVETSRADIRRDVLQAYFSVENTTAGKRAQILDFVESIATDDPLLAKWAKQERPRVDEAAALAKKEEERQQTRIDELERQREVVAQAKVALSDLLLAQGVAAAWVDRKPTDTKVLVPGALGRFMTDEQQKQVLRLFEVAGADEIPEPFGCSTLEEARLSLAAPPYAEYGELEVSREDAIDAAEDCRKELVEWASSTATRFEDRISGRAETLEEQLIKSVGRSVASTDSGTAIAEPGSRG